MYVMKKLFYVAVMAFCLNLASGSLIKVQAQTVTHETKKGWSKKKKGAVIGAGVGAATGAVVSKKKGKGAIIGGAVGAGAGYLYGRHKDKKHPSRKTVYKTTVK
jgi:uncharacterized protein YcfJ